MGRRGIKCSEALKSRLSDVRLSDCEQFRKRTDKDNWSELFQKCFYIFTDFEPIPLVIDKVMSKRVTVSRYLRTVLHLVNKFVVYA